ncbi:hypothetical protein A5782_08975 [Mycobacterium sp. 852002-40037_SCH5390672]|nr:hypothetical protein A5782_08975 [Mycobacterium sp. 852002-40037_SCH5390672]
MANRDIDSLTIKLGGEKTVLLNSPRLVRHVLTSNAKNYTKNTVANEYFRQNIADGILTAEGARWAEDRALLSPIFRNTAPLDGQIRACVEATSARLASCATSGAPVNLTAAMSELTLAIATQIMFRARHEPFVDLCREIGQLLDETTSVLPQNRDRVKSARRSMLDTVQSAIGESCDPLGPVLQVLRDDIRHQHADVLNNQLLTLLLAGFETTANSLSWTWILLSQHRMLYAKLQQSLDLQGEQSALLRAVLEESFRLYPSAWVIGRRAVNDDHVDGVDITAGSAVLISPFLIQRHPRWWPNPDEFRPERFLPGGQRPTNHYAHIPFGAGPRYCLGAAYALQEAVIIIATLAQRFTFWPIRSPDDIEPELKFVLRAPDPFPVTVLRRPAPINDNEGKPG